MTQQTIVHVQIFVSPIATQYEKVFDVNFYLLWLHMAISKKIVSFKFWMTPGDNPLLHLFSILSRQLSHHSLSQVTLIISCVVRSPCFGSATVLLVFIQEQRWPRTIFHRERGLSSNAGFSSGNCSRQLFSWSFPYAVVLQCKYWVSCTTKNVFISNFPLRGECSVLNNKINILVHKEIDFRQTNVKKKMFYTWVRFHLLHC